MPIDPITKIVLENQKYLISLQKENKELKKILKHLDKTVEILSNKIQEFEILFDAAEIIEDSMRDHETQDEIYDLGWTPYSDNDDFMEDYDDEDEYDTN
jgi:predicted RNase H-like nuclease (RuvC/YqgF family)